MTKSTLKHIISKQGRAKQSAGLKAWWDKRRAEAAEGLGVKKKPSA